MSNQTCENCSMSRKEILAQQTFRQKVGSVHDRCWCRSRSRQTDRTFCGPKFFSLADFCLASMPAGLTARAVQCWRRHCACAPRYWFDPLSFPERSVLLALPRAMEAGDLRSNDPPPLSEVGERIDGESVKLHLRHSHVTAFFPGELQDMMSALEGGGGHGKVDVVHGGSVNFIV